MPAAALEPVVETSNGRVRGQRGAGAFAFKGIRYGATTAGDNRFRPPLPPEPWAGIQEATSYPPRAPQRDPAGRFRNAAAPGVAAPGLVLSRLTVADEPESEDCLLLNVWTPTLEPLAKRPVMVWLHGGGFNALSGSSNVYAGSRLASRHGAVVVTLNHRLGALGYTHLSGLCGDDFAHTGNLGTLDIVAALRWVRDNIGAFGGDPGRVLLFGESGGGWKVCVALATAPARGLFHRAAIQSGSALAVAEPEDAGEVAERFLSTLGLTTRHGARLRELPLEAIVAAQFEVESQLAPRIVPNMIRGFVPVLDGAIVPAHPFEPAASAFSADVPVIVGFNRTEMTLFSSQETLDLTEEGLCSHAAALLGRESGPALATYRALHPDASPARLLQYLHCDLTMLPFAPVIAERHAELGGAPSYLYRFDWETPVHEGALMSPHALEVPFVFDTTEAASALNGGGRRPQVLADRLSRAWVAFAESGDPNTPQSGLPEWPSYDAGRRATMLFDDESRVADDPQRVESEIAARFVDTLRASHGGRRRRVRPASRTTRPTSPRR